MEKMAGQRAEAAAQLLELLRFGAARCTAAWGQPDTTGGS